MAVLETYRAYFYHKDDNGNNIDQDLLWPLDTYKIIKEHSVPFAMKEFAIKFPNHKLLGLAGTSDLSEKILNKLISTQ
jgi:hypothetical protein|tara:strand:+ start:1312 stop:1545 length:234 start_codon:yes stop_codon:yes gene_type:complete